MQDTDGQMEVMVREREDLEVIALETPTETFKKNEFRAEFYFYFFRI